MLRTAAVRPLALVVLALFAVGCKGSSESPSPRAPSPTAHPPGPPPPGISPAAAPVTPLSPGARTEDERNTIAVFKNAAPSTVFVTQHRVAVDWFGRALEQAAGSGSGFIWDKQGHIVTNYHVIEGARRLSVTLQDHKTFPAVVRGAEPRKDIAVLRIEGAPAIAWPSNSMVPPNGR